ncbi:AAA family ATPase [Actinocorallia sp. API 0066]|uniref:ATP-binding protein n=1 Tax=Actinocorallia sp. API 0066 TaxID=2896846 RepID=UPI001E28E557|nr:LuxR family transcriptional regulator [Actinocorallia sp. API 0066]MCD0449760.1 AAA family ATPase [Actinocorallia sp. API 0066]
MGDSGEFGRAGCAEGGGDGVGERSVLVGRAAELGVLDTAFGAVCEGGARAVLVGGEAGVGKTRLIREFGERARERGARVLVGGCMELGVDGFPFAPFTAVVRLLVREIGADGVGALLGGRTAGLARLLPEFEDTAGDERFSQVRLFELVLTLLDRLTARGPLVLVIEDAHWADRSSRDLLTFLVRNLGAAGALLIVVTFRADELHRAHPLRPLLAELGRIDRVVRQDVGRLSRQEVAQLMANLRGVEPEPHRVRQFFARSEGNPLFVEALMEADGGIACELPESLRDLLLAGVQRLPDDTQELLRVASAGGARIEHRLLAAVSGLDELGLARGLRPAVEGNVLAVDGEGYAFRHALIREALHDDLLPGEHTRLHARYAEALEADASLVPPGRAAAELAFHWHAAHNLEGALISAWRAAAQADKSAAYAEELRFLERVLELWDRVPEAAGRIGVGHEDVMEEAICAADLAGDSERGIKLATAMLRTVGADPLRRATLLERRGRLLHRAGRERWLDDMRESVRLVEPLEPSVRSTRILAAFAQYVFMGRASDEALEAAGRALETARRVGDPYAECSALLTLACLGSGIEYGARESALMEEAERIAHEHDLTQLVLRAAVNRSHLLEGSGRHAEGAEVALRGMEQAREWGLFRTQGSFLAINRAESLLSLGRLDAALAAVEQGLAADPPPSHQLCLMQLEAEIMLCRGEVGAAAALLERCRESRAWETDQRLQEYRPLVRSEAELAVALGGRTRALDHVRPLLAFTGRPDDSRYTWPVLLLAARLAATPEEFAPFAERAARTDVFGPLQELQHATFQAEAARFRAGAGGPGARPGPSTSDASEPRSADWAPVLAGWERIGQPLTLARVLVSAASAAASAGDRAAALAHLGRAAELAESLGARALHREATELARRVGGSASPAHGLTARELEVLHHLSLGRSNREIAERLFISAKTASVHVSHILAKLGAATRTEAAATARRLGVPVP